MYPGTIVEYDDQSAISTIPVTTVRNKPLFVAVFSSDKGTEKWTRISDTAFFDMYGKNISFSKHGQPLLQAAMTINAGAELLCKRIVADDSTLANIGIVAKITKTKQEVQSKDNNGNLLYLDSENRQTTEVTDNPVMTSVDTSSIRYTLKTVTNASNIDEVYSSMVTGLGDGEYLLYLIADNGRGTSKKRIKIIPNYRLSRSLDYTLYTLSVLEGNVEDESMTFSVNPNLIVNGQNISLQSMIRTYSTQLTCIENSEGMDSFIEALTKTTGLTSEELYRYDPLFGHTNRGESITGITVDNTGIDLQYSYGQMLQSGSNGSFGDAPFSNEEAWADQAVKAFSGAYDNSIFNVDQYRIDAIVDANYPDKVKRAIESLAIFREDLMYFRDQRLGKTSLSAIKLACDAEAKSMFCATYPQSYDIIDPYTKRQISTTIGYDLAQLLVEHCNNGRIIPTAGIKNNMIIKNAIYGTLSFAPTICPDPEGNQKEKLDDLRVNYATYIDNQLVIETLYTSQEKFTQWSFINNVMGIQEVAKAIRKRCPAIRYSFIDGEDLETYKADVNEVIESYASSYKQLSLEYARDSTYSANKIFYAVLKVVYRDFVQTEWFKVTALSAVTTTTES